MSSVNLEMADYTQWAWSGSRDPFFKLCPNYIFKIRDDWHFEFRML